jgi:hypothetical protein
MERFLGKLKWILVIAALGGPVMAYFSWQDTQRRKDVLAHGVEATASIDGATRRKGRRSGTSYKINLSWADAKGVSRSAKDVAVSNEFADQIITDNQLTVDSTKIRYIADGSDTPNLIVSDDEMKQEDTDQVLIYVGIGAGVIGAIGAAFLFMRSRRRQPQAA